MTTVFKAILGFFGASWITPALYALAIIGPAAGGFYEGYHIASEKCRSAELQARIESLQRDLDAQKIADQAAAHALAQSQAENSRLQQEVQDYATAIKSHPPGVCPIPADALDRLRKLRGG